MEAIAQAAMQQKPSDPIPRLNASIDLKWAEGPQVPATPIKSLAEIQAEEQEELAKARIKTEGSPQSGQSAGIWNSASSSLSWTGARTSTATATAPNVWSLPGSSAVSSNKGDAGFTGSPNVSIWGSTTNSGGGGAVGLWDDCSTTSPSKPTPPANPVVKSKPVKNRTRKEEQQVMKLFEQKSQYADDFTTWCVQTLSGLQSSVDTQKSSNSIVPTFVTFLKDIESPFEVNDYVRSYLGEGKEARDFAHSFLERRSKWRNSQKAAPAEDDMCKPAPAVNPLSNDFQEVKSKTKKTKKNKMYRVADNQLLGFSVTAAQDRINVGDRDYGEGM
ncbi:hypothetical protein B566_EDAN001711 [Ephemera danica]|nr:hypothetical protein B566_EDAN001711 [Ephemera danica]